MLSGEATHINL